MRKITSVVFVAIFISFFVTVKAYAFLGIGKIYKNSNPNCKKFDFYCKRTSQKISAEESKELIKVEEKTEEKIISTSERNSYYDNCKKFDFYCKRKAKKNSRTVSKKIINNNDGYTELNAYTGMFDFSDGKQRSVLVGMQHQNEDLFRNSFLGRVSPISGGFLTEKNALYVYTGIQAEYELGFMTITPSFAPGYYNYGNGKDLGHPLEFKTEVQATIDLSETSHLGMSYNHISNASLGTKNPGANSYIFNFLKQF